MTNVIPIPDENELQWTFIQSSGPGGQNVNKVATAVQLRFDVSHSYSLPEPVRKRLIHLAGHRITQEGVLIIEARRYRTQEQNRRAALARLIELLQKAYQKPKIRHKTRPTMASRQRRLESKRRRSDIKRLRNERISDKCS
jgi:ribosome-associated protein